MFYKVIINHMKINSIPDISSTPIASQNLSPVGGLTLSKVIKVACIALLLLSHWPQTAAAQQWTNPYCTPQDCEQMVVKDNGLGAYRCEFIEDGPCYHFPVTLFHSVPKDPVSSSHPISKLKHKIH